MDREKLHIDPWGFGAPLGLEYFYFLQFDDSLTDDFSLDHGEHYLLDWPFALENLLLYLVSMLFVHRKVSEFGCCAQGMQLTSFIFLVRSFGIALWCHAGYTLSFDFRQPWSVGYAVFVGQPARSEYHQ